jgi:hypothetical protein
VGKKLTALVACAPLLSLAARPDRNAYLNHAVTSVSGLVAEVEHDPQVADRYMRHFGMTRGEVIAMFSKLHVARLDQDIPVTMYSVPAGGYIKEHDSTMRKGELVFKAADGSVVLRLKCGNPVVGGKLQVSFDALTRTEGAIPPLRPLLAVQAPPDSNGPIAEILPPDTQPDVTPPVYATDPVGPSITNLTNNTPNTAIAKGSNPNLTGLLIAVPLLAFAGASLHQESHSFPVPVTPSPTPEPMSMLLLATGAGGLLLRRRSAARS